MLAMSAAHLRRWRTAAGNLPHSFRQLRRGFRAGQQAGPGQQRGRQVQREGGPTGEVAQHRLGALAPCLRLCEHLPVGAQGFSQGLGPGSMQDQLGALVPCLQLCEYLLKAKGYQSGYKTAKSLTISLAPLPYDGGCSLATGGKQCH